MYINLIYCKSTQFDSQRKLGGEDLITSIRQQIDSSIEEKFQSFNQTNDNKRKLFIVSNSNIHSDIVNSTHIFFTS